MTIKKVNERLEYLRNALVFSLEYNRLLTVGQRIMINQERAAWFRELSWKGLNREHEIRPKYRVSPEIEHKLSQIHDLIEINGWKRPSRHIKELWK